MKRFIFCFGTTNPSDSSDFFNFILFCGYFFDLFPDCTFPHGIHIQVVIILGPERSKGEYAQHNEYIFHEFTAIMAEFNQNY